MDEVFGHLRVFVAGRVAADAARRGLRSVWPELEADEAGASFRSAKLRAWVIDVLLEPEQAEAARVLATPMIEAARVGEAGQRLSVRRFVGGVADGRALVAALEAVGISEVAGGVQQSQSLDGR